MSPTSLKQKQQPQQQQQQHHMIQVHVGTSMKRMDTKEIATDDHICTRYSVTNQLF